MWETLEPVLWLFVNDLVLLVIFTALLLVVSARSRRSGANRGLWWLAAANAVFSLVGIVLLLVGFWAGYKSLVNQSVWLIVYAAAVWAAIPLTLSKHVANMKPLLRLLIMDASFVALCGLLLLAFTPLEIITVVIGGRLWMSVYCGAFIGVFAALLLPLAVRMPAAFAVLRRNFVNYFTTPVGYLFLCLFVVLSAGFAFFPPEFFNANIATLHTLNWVLPFIMVIYIPAITMGIWAEERRDGTDELLLTMPAGDFEIVLGKYLAAAAIFSAALLFSQVSNFFVLNALAVGTVDIGLFSATYLGYWMVGMAMLAIGTAASFLTRDLAVAFILGVVFNVPLAIFFLPALLLPDNNLALAVKRWSMGGQLENFTYGVVSVSSIVYFAMVVLIGVYLSLVLIGRRHWLGGRDGSPMLGHYVWRALALVVIAVGASLYFTDHDPVRYDATVGKVSSLSQATLRRIDKLDLKHPVYVEAFISDTVPESFVKTKYDLIALLREIKARGRGRIVVNIHDKMDPFCQEGEYAEDRYGIRPTAVPSEDRGVLEQKEIFLAAAFSSGAERVVVPFFGKGSPVEYELARSLCTVGDSDASARKTIGVVRTDAPLNGGIDFQTFRPIPQQQIIAELKKQYEVEDVNPNEPIERGKYDVLLLVQPSSLTPPQLENVLTAIREGHREVDLGDGRKRFDTSVAIFEDPFPARWPTVPGTDDPKRPRGGMMGMQQPPEEKCHIDQLWQALGVYMVRAYRGNARTPELDPKSRQYKATVDWTPFTAIVWQHYNPYPKTPDISDAAVFASPNAPDAKDAFNASEPVVSGLREVLFLAPGAVEERPAKSHEAKDFKFTPLVTIGSDTGIITAGQLRQPDFAGSRELLKEAHGEADPQSDQETKNAYEVNKLVSDPQFRTKRRYILAARVRGELSNEEAPAGEDAAAGKDEKADDAGKQKDNAKGSKSNSSKEEKKNITNPPGKLDAVIVTDIDVLESLFMMIRNQPGGPVDYKFQNVEMVLNIADSLAGDEDFLTIRTRRPQHGTLKLIEARIHKAEEKAREEIDKFEADVNRTREEAKKKRDKLVADIEAELNKLKSKGQLDSRAVRELSQKLEWQQARNRSIEETENEQRTDELKRNLYRIRRDEYLHRQAIEIEYKILAGTLPPISPLLIALVVFLARWVRERAGVGSERRRR